MSREEREALLDAETPDLPDRTSPYRAGARRLAGIVIVSLVISAAVSLALILTLTSGLRERVQREVLDELQARQDAAKVELPKEAVLVYVPKNCREPLSSGLADHVALAASADVLAKILADGKIQDTSWYAKHADNSADALKNAVKVTPIPGRRFLAFHSDELPEAERELILARCGSAYAETCTEIGQVWMRTRLALIRKRLRTLRDQIVAGDAEYVRLSDEGRVQLDLPAIEKEAERRRCRERKPQSATDASANGERLYKASRLGDLVHERRGRCWRLATQIALLEVALTAGVDSALPRLCANGEFIELPEDPSSLLAAAQRQSTAREIEALRQQLLAAGKDAESRSEAFRQLAGEMGSNLSDARDNVRYAVAEDLEAMLVVVTAMAKQVMAAVATSRPATAPASRPADRDAELKEAGKKAKAANERVKVAVGQYVKAWKLEQRRAGLRAEARGSFRLMESLENRIDELTPAGL